MNAISANDTGLPNGCAERLAQFAQEQQVAAFPPEQVLDDQGHGATFSAAFLRYCGDTGLSLDWAYLGQGQPLARHQSPESYSQALDMAGRFDAVFRQFDDGEQLIILGALKALSAGQITMEEYAARVDDQISRHRAGKPVYASELATPDAPGTRA